MLTYENYLCESRLWGESFPSHWEITPLYGIGKIKSICNCEDMPLLSVYLDSGVVLFSDKAEKRTNATSKDMSKYQRVDAGDLVLNNQQAWRGSVGVSNYEGIVSPAYLIVELGNQLTRKFANYLFRSPIMVSQYLINSKGVGSIQRNIYWCSLKRVLVPVPTILEQEQIVKYLDWQISKINKLISAKRKEIVILMEQRQRTIDDGVLMSCKITDSEDTENQYGVIVPENWDIIKFNGYFSFFKGLGITKKDLVDEGVPVISYGQVHAKSNTGTEINDSLIRYVDEEYLSSSQNSLVKQGDFIFADTSEDFEGVGNCVFVDRTDTIFAGYHTLVARPKDGKINRYLAYLFKSSYWRYQLRKRVNGVKVYSITQKVLKNAFVILPSEEDKEKIVLELDKKCKSISGAISKVNIEITTLEELKRKMVYDVVTGKIDVRDIEIPEFEFVEESENLYEENDSDLDDENDDEEV